jgi:hypothetical protein
LEQFINLNRTFYPLPANYSHAAKDSDINTSEDLGFPTESMLHWDKLSAEFRVIILAEAGAGKTQEIRQTAKLLRSQGKPAFFLRLENITGGLGGAFEVGTKQEFQRWLDSTEEGWLLLDSVDEARLRDPKDFERAIRQLSDIIAVAIPRTHLIITSRTSAWRGETDLNLCNAKFPPVDDRETQYETDDVTLDDVVSSAAHPEPTKTHTNSSSDQADTKFKVYSLVNLTKEQVITFIKARGIDDSEKFLSDVERQDGWAFMTRPQDLEELISFWKAQGRIGTRFDMMNYSVERRLKERDQDRADSKPFTPEKALKGARILAAACVLTNESTIRVPDGSQYAQGIDVESVLTDWDNTACQILLSRPIFDEAIYGTVRYHHRSVREFLTAQWLSEELKNEGSRERIESLFFRTQYEQVVVKPSMKPILSWMVLFDTKIMLRVYKIEPEIILLGGDPSKLPLEERRAILISICQRIASGNSDKSVERHAAVQRFASPDMADDIISLLEQYQNSNYVTDYLMNLIWQGRMKKALPLATKFILEADTEQYGLFTALKTLKELGSRDDLNSVIQTLLSSEKPPSRSFLAELFKGLEPTKNSVKQIKKSLENVKDKSRHGHDSLGYALADFIRCSDADIVTFFIEEIGQFLHREPVIERRYCKISKQYSWLLSVCKLAIEKLILSKHSGVFSSESLFVLTQAPVFKEYDELSSLNSMHDLSTLIADWSELNHALFWNAVGDARKHLDKKGEDTVDIFWQVYVSEKYWNFSKVDFKRIVDAITGRPLMDDKLIALTLAFVLYKKNDRPKGWLTALRKIARNDDSLSQRLTGLLHPPAQSGKIRKWKQEETRWQRRNKEHEKKRQVEDDAAIRWLKKNYQTLRYSGLEKGQVSQNQYYMYDRMHRLDGAHLAKWTGGNWRGLIKDYGEDVAAAFRDGMISFWRTYIPLLRSEGDKENETKLGVLFGLSGIEVESRERPGWLDDITVEEAGLACRYAFNELNGFPNWFPKLYEKFPELLQKLILNEITWELETQFQKPNETRHYVLSKVSWSCEWLWNGIATQLVQILSEEPVDATDLGDALKIIEGSSVVSDQDLAELAQSKCSTVSSKHNLAYWYATWIGIEPQLAIRSFSLYIDTLNSYDKDEAATLAMRTAVKLVGGRRGGPDVREAFKAPKYLKELYLLMHRYIRVEDDLDRANKGVYSPGLRDDAQDARDRLYSILKSIPGKESYLAMIELSQTHPAEGYRNWMLRDAKERAEIDADGPPWTISKFNEFAKALESTPTNHRELFDLAVQRLKDMKHDLEESDGSIASTLAKEDQETGIRKVIAKWCNDRSKERYVVTQEEELPDAKRPDCRFRGSNFDAPVPLELKLADNWGGALLFERLENQLCGDYLRDSKSNRGIFVLVYRGDRKSWQIPDRNLKVTFLELVESLQNHWKKIATNYPKIDEIKVIGIDLTKRMDRVKSVKKAK